MYTTQNLYRSKQLLLLCTWPERSTPRICFLNALRLVPFLSSLPTFDQMKGPWKRSECLPQATVSKRVVQKHCSLGVGLNFWSWITQIHTFGHTFSCRPSFCETALGHNNLWSDYWVTVWRSCPHWWEIKTKIKGLDSKEITSLPKIKNVMIMARHLNHRRK